jgi:hypothetical protein
MGFFASSFLILSIMFIDRDFSIYVFCFVCSHSIDMAKSIYGLRFNSLGRQRRWWGFVTTTTITT